MKWKIQIPMMMKALSDEYLEAMMFLAEQKDVANLLKDAAKVEVANLKVDEAKVEASRKAKHSFTK
jgi:hypothetical protein